MKFYLTLLVSSVGGFIALSYEILWYRAFSFITWGQATTFGMLLGFYLAGVAVGSNRIRHFCRSDASDSRQLLLLSRLLIGANLLGFLVVPTFSVLAPLAPLVGLGFVALSAAALGAVFPLACHYGIPSDAKTGARLSYVYVANIVGSASGSYLTGLVLMDYLSTRALSSVLLVAGVALGGMVLIIAKPGRRELITTVLVGGAALTVALPLGGVLFDGLYERMLYKRFGGTPFAHVLENRHGVVAVSQRGHVFGGGAYDGVFSTSLTHDVNLVERALAVAALHPNPRRVLMIGLASGSWAQVVANLPQVEELVIVEINPAYLELIRQYPAVSGLLQNPKVKVVIDDGRRWLLRNPSQTFDFVLMNTTWNWRASVTNLLSREFMELARLHLAPHGILYFNTTGSRACQRTAALTFPYALRVLNFIAASDSPIAFDQTRWELALTTTRSNGEPLLDPSSPLGQRALQRLSALGHTYSSTEMMALERREPLLSRTARDGIVTDDNMLSEFREPFLFPGGYVESSGT